jgi:hypothetical protein
VHSSLCSCRVLSAPCLAPNHHCSVLISWCPAPSGYGNLSKCLVPNDPCSMSSVRAYRPVLKFPVPVSLARPCPVTNAQCPMASAPYPVSSFPCLLFSAQYPVPRAQWSVPCPSAQRPVIRDPHPAPSAPPNAPTLCPLSSAQRTMLSLQCPCYHST